MGVFHFTGLGKAIGAVTCAVDYVERILDQIEDGTASDAARKLVSGSGGINHKEEKRGKIEGIVCFTSKEIIHENMKAFEYEGCNNPSSVRNELEKVLPEVWKTADPDQGRQVFWCEVDINNFNDCFEKVLKVTYRFSPHGKQGKEIWCNLTGGSNTIGLALLTMARLTGQSNKHYLLSPQSRFQKAIRIPREINPLSPNQDGYFQILPFLRTQIDNVSVYEILAELHLTGEIKTTELYSRLKNKGFLSHVREESSFRRDYMLRLNGNGYTHFDQSSDTCSLSEEGRAFLDDLEELENAINFENFMQKSHDDIVEESKGWTWLTAQRI